MCGMEESQSCCRASRPRPERGVMSVQPAGVVTRSRSGGAVVVIGSSSSCE